MKKAFLSLMMLVAVFGSCQSRDAKKNASSDQMTVTNQLSATEVENRVRDIYVAVFKVYNEEDSLRNLDVPIENGAYEHRHEFIANYCSEDWGKLVKEIDENDSIYHQDELGFWEADYWIMGQDWHELSVSDVKVVSLSDDKATVDFNLHNFGQVSTIRLNMVYEGGAWRIDDFIDTALDLDWKNLMEEYLTNEENNRK